SDRRNGEGRPEPAGRQPAGLGRRPGRNRGSRTARARLPPDDAAAGSRAPAQLQRRAQRPGGRTGPGRTRSPRPGQPVPTGVLLRLEAVRSTAPPELEAEIADTQTLAHQSMDELLTV